MTTSQKPTNNYYVTTFYQFLDLNHLDLQVEKIKWIEFCESLDIKGLMILASEGVNATVGCGSLSSLKIFKDKVKLKFNLSNEDFKDSECHKIPFRILKVSLRKEIVTLENPNYHPTVASPKYLTPAEWNQTLLSEDVVCIDTRNWYETKMGKFKGALDLNIDEFTEFPEKVAAANIPKDKKVLLYCTGGIRCEKAVYEMKKQGYEEVYQLKNGILKYMEEFPHQLFEGECFVFDERVAVDQELQASKRFSFCPHCGQPAETIQSCKRCDSEFKICDNCEKLSEVNKLCSKNCAYQFGRFPEQKGPRQVQGYKAQKQNAYFISRSSS